VPEDETSSQPPYDPGSMSWESTTNFGPHIAQWERDRWEVFLAQIAIPGTSSGDAGVLGNFPEEVEQEHRQVEQALSKEVEQLKAMLAQVDSKYDAKLTFETERREEVEEMFQEQVQVVRDLYNQIDWIEWRIPPP